VSSDPWWERNSLDFPEYDPALYCLSSREHSEAQKRAGIGPRHSGKGAEQPSEVSLLLPRPIAHYDISSLLVPNSVCTKGSKF
jgi:hypothetical protein